MNIDPILSDALLKIPSGVTRVFRFYNNLIFPKELYLFEKTLNVVSEKYGLDKDKFRALLLSFKEEDLDENYQMLVNEFVTILEINIYNDDALRPRIQAIRSIESKSLLLENKNLLQNINNKLSLSSINRKEMFIMIERVGNLDICDSIFLLKSLIRAQDIEYINDYFDQLETLESSRLMDNQNYSIIFQNYILDILNDYEHLDPQINSRILRHINYIFDYLEYYVDDFPDEKISHKLNIIMESAIFEFQRSDYSNSKIFLVDLMIKTLDIYNLIDFSSSKTMLNITAYYVRFINKILNSISKRMIFYEYHDLNLYRKSDFRFCLNLVHKILYLIISSEIFITNLEDNKNVLNLKNILRVLYIKLDDILDEYKDKESLTKDDRLIFWDISSHIIPILSHIENINKELR